MRSRAGRVARSRFTIAATVLCALFFGANAEAQTLRDRVWISVNAGMQIPADDLADRFEFQRFVEQATVDVDYDGDPGIFFDGGLTFRLWKRLGAGVALSRFSHDSSAGVEARIPHPFFDNQHREISGTADGVTRAETGIHVQLTYVANTRGALKMVLSGGPSYFDLEQDLVGGVQYAESFPFDEATFTAADLSRASATGLGFNVGADVAWMLGRQFGIGGLIRFSRASIDLDTNDRRTIEVKAGGFQAGAGLRILF